MARRGGLGTHLDALIPTSLTVVVNTKNDWVKSLSVAELNSINFSCSWIEGWFYYNMGSSNGC